jgi:alpha-galactosidase
LRQRSAEARATGFRRLEHSSPMRMAEFASRPPMGWNSFDSYGVYLDEAMALQNMRVMAQRLRPAGYRIFVIDMGWYSGYDIPTGSRFPLSSARPSLCIDPWGRYVPHPHVFPRGLSFIADQAHDLGLLFGLHIMRGIPRAAVQRDLPILGTQRTAREIADPSSRCVWNDFNFGLDMSKPGAQQYYDSFISLIASWGVDFIKADDWVPYPAEIHAIANAMQAQPRPMLLSLSPGNVVDYAHIDAYRRANMVRLTRDVWDRRISLDRCFDAWDRFQAQGASGFWPDLDMIPMGRLRVCLPPDRVAPGCPLPSEGVARECEWTVDQQKTFLTMLAMAASPMFIGSDLLTLEDSAVQMLTHPQLIACNQNGVVGRKVWAGGGVEVWHTPHKGGRGASGWIAIFNRNLEPVSAKLDRAQLGLQSDRDWHASDVWQCREIVVGGDGLQGTIAADGVVFLKFGWEG